MLKIAYNFLLEFMVFCKCFLCVCLSQSNIVVAKSGRGASKKIAKVASSGEIADATRLDDSEDQKNSDIQQRGARLALVLVAQHCSDRLMDLLPSLWHMLSDPLTSDTGVTSDESGVESVLAALQLLEVTAPAFSATFHAQLTGLLPGLLRCLTLPLTVVRYMAARCIATMSAVVVTDTMTFVYEHVLPLLGVTENVTSRQGAIECVASILGWQIMAKFK
jgi:TATA-binding protein-associated factor